MDEKILNEFKKHIGETKDYEFFNKKTGKSSIFTFKPLGAKHIAKYLYISDKMPRPKMIVVDGKRRQETQEEMMSRFGKDDYEIFETLVELLGSMITQNPDYSDLPKDVIDMFVFRNFAKLMTIMTELNSDINQEQIQEDKMKQFIQKANETEQTPKED